MFYVKVTYNGCTQWDTEPHTERRAQREVMAWKRRGCRAKAYPATPAILALVTAAPLHAWSV